MIFFLYFNVKCYMRKKNSQVGIFYEYYYSEILRKTLLKLNFMKEKKIIENKEEKTNKK